MKTVTKVVRTGTTQEIVIDCKVIEKNLLVFPYFLLR